MFVAWKRDRISRTAQGKVKSNQGDVRETNKHAVLFDCQKDGRFFWYKCPANNFERFDMLLQRSEDAKVSLCFSRVEI